MNCLFFKCSFDVQVLTSKAETKILFSYCLLQQKFAKFQLIRWDIVLEEIISSASQIIYHTHQSIGCCFDAF